ncbi:MAG: ankyrin repeat domain-containing protein, partial [Elusimicrobia bacterium]|nr:ankyrin repeat domain-containing protein [Elusimicrobiota bacterium]
LARGANVAARDEDGWTPLMWAAAHGDEASVAALLDAGADIRVIARGNGQGPLTLAAKWNRVGVVSLLLRRGASAGARDSIGWTALMWASLQGRTDVVAALLDGRASIDATDGAGNTPLMLAARQGRTATVKVLLARGASAAARNGDGKSARDLAAAAGYPAIIALLKAGK